MKKLIIPTFLILTLLVGCTSPQSNPSFDEIKKMMADAIQTEDGKKAIRQILSEEEFRELLVLEQSEVKKSIEETLLSEEGESFWKKNFEDPKFTETFAKSLQDQQEDVMTKLMADASFQKQLEGFFKQPDMQKVLEDILQSSTMKEQYEKAIEEIIDSPLLQTKWEELIKKAGKAEKSEDQEEGKKEEESQPDDKSNSTEKSEDGSD